MNAPAHIILPGTGAELLRRELALAFAGAGCRVSEAAPRSLHDPAHPGRLGELLAAHGPSLLFSVNFQGLHPLRETLDLLRKAGGQAAAWLVDNPWNLLSGMRDPRWKSLTLFVTDASFIGPLREHGAERVHHLPLAACPELFAPNAARDKAFPPPKDLAPFVFVGRSSFPGKGAYFAGQSLPEDLEQEARSMLARGQRPDLLWWEKRLGACGPFWPGKKARLPALGAEESNLAWRALCLAKAAQAGSRMESGYPGLDIFGDADWQALAPPEARLRPPVDYYARLPGIYASARYSLCLTSQQLPQGLNQRHFDVWSAGGLALCDASPGLCLFPEELTRPVTFTSAEDIERVAEGLERSPGRAALVADWRDLLRREHTYAHRVRDLLRHFGA